MTRGVRLLILLAILLGTGEIVLVLLRIVLPDLPLPVLLAFWSGSMLVAGVLLWRWFRPRAD